MMTKDHFNILFLSERNTARSLLAEAVTNRLGQGRFAGFSAGLKPAEALDPMVLDVLRLSQFPTEGLRPKHWTEFAGAGAPPLDFVFALCDRKAGEAPPHWPGRPVTADWRYPDPYRLHGEEWQRRKELSAVLAGLERQLRAFMLLPLHSLDRISLRSRLEELHQHAEAR